MEQISPNHILHSKVDDDEAITLANHFFDKGRFSTDKSFFHTMGDLNKIEKVFLVGAQCYRKFLLPTPEENNSILHLVGFRHTKTRELHGYLLYLCGYPWWSSSYLGVHELGVMAITEGVGVGRKAAGFLKQLVDLNLVDVVEVGTALSGGNIICNSYKKAGFTPYKSFLYTGEE